MRLSTTNSRSRLPFFFCLFRLLCFDLNAAAASSGHRGGGGGGRHNSAAVSHRSVPYSPRRRYFSGGRLPWVTSTAVPRGGGSLSPGKKEEEEQQEEGDDLSTTTVTTSSGSGSRGTVVEEYIAAVEERDARDCTTGSSSSDESSNEENDREHSESSSGGGAGEDKTGGDEGKQEQTPSASSSDKSPSSSSDADAAVLGVKSHTGKKGNAVGDPDGEGSDDDDDDSDSEDLTEVDWEELEEDLELMGLSAAAAATTADPTTQVQLEVEFVEEGGEKGGEDGTSEEAGASEDDGAPRLGGGGVGVRLGQRFNNRRKNRNNNSNNKARNNKASNNNSNNGKVWEAQLLKAWSPHVYLPPSDVALKYLADRSRNVDGAAKARLDRRTLYAGLVLEWVHAGSGGNGETAPHRKYLDPSASQALQSALSLATQPQWRKSYPRHNGVRLYDPDEPNRGTTLAMQETIALAMAHSLGAGMVILDDDIMSSSRKQLMEEGYAEDEVKPAALLRTLLTSAREGSIRQGAGGSISACMRQDLKRGLDDPYDERATSSCHDMSEWEEKWKEGSQEEKENSKHLPLVIFLRTDCCKSLLKSKSAVELLLQECNSSDSINLIVLGKGVDAKTTSLPHDTGHDSHDGPDMSSRNQAQNNAAPWFGFSPNNQNASGQNDPEGSRRFNIFLARTVDPSGTPGILGAIAPPQAGNLFPHMMAMQARERMQQHGDDSPVKADLERWAAQLQQQMQSNGGSPLPPPQFFNASLSPFESSGENPAMPPPPPEVIQQTLQQAMSELLDRLAQMNDDTDDDSPESSSDLHKAFAEVLRNENLRRGIAENLARAAPALSDPKCQGVMLSVYVPPPPQFGKGRFPGLANGSGKNQQNNMGGFFSKILNNQEEAEEGSDDELDANTRQKRIRTMAAAAAVLAANNANANREESANGEPSESKADRNLARLESLCRPIIVKAPTDPVRAKSWEAWIRRERGAVTFRQNRRVLNEQLEAHSLTLQEHVGTRGAGSSLRQMLSVRDISDDMEDVIKCSIELEAAKAQRRQESPDETLEKEKSLDVDITLSQLLLTEEGLVVENTDDAGAAVEKRNTKPDGVQYIHPSSLEMSLTIVCRISPSPGGGMSISGQTASHRTREEISALAQDKHERALVSQVVSPQDIGVNYDMIGGLSDVKELLRQSITYPLKFPHLYSEGIAREAVKGVLLFGPPGTGKTMLAKAVATEGGASFLSVDASSVENKWLGESEKNAKAVFTLARRLAPCVIFVDEVDSLLSSREGTSDDSAHGTLTSVKTTMMSEWDGLNSGTNGAGEAGSDRVIVIGSTNRPFDLDEAVLRRFPRRILVDLPDLETRTEILEVTLAENRLDPNVNMTKIAEKLEGYTGSDIKEVCREAVVQISHEQAKLLDQGFANTREDVTQGSLQRLRPVTMDDFEAALSKLKRSVSEKGRELTRVWEWNDEYGEIKKESRNHLPHLANMYL